MTVLQVRYAILASLAAASVGLMAGQVRGAPDDWNVDASGLWTLPGNWSAGVPTATSDVTINRPAGDFLVTLDAGVQAINTLVTAERLSVTGGTLTVAGSVDLQNTFTLGGGMVLNSTLSTSGAGSIVLTSGVLSGVALAANAGITNSASATIQGGLTLVNSTLTLASTAGFPSLLAAGSQTVGGTGVVELAGGNGFTAEVGNGGGGTVTIGSGVVVRTGTSAGVGGVIGLIDPQGLVNQGVISSQTSGKELRIFSSTWSNSGVLEAKSGGILNLGGTWANTGTITLNAGTLNLGGAVTTAGLNLGTFARTGGAVNVTGTLDNTGAQLPLTAATGNFVLAGGTIKGGTVTATGGAQLLASTTLGTLDGVSLGTNLSVGAGQTVGVKNTLTLSGVTVTLSGAASANAALSINGSQAIGGTGVIVLDGTGGFSGDMKTAAGTPTLTLTAGVTVRTGAGSSPILGQIHMSGLVNEGVISSQTSGKELQLFPATFTNSGLLEAKSGGILTILNSVWSNTGTMTLNGGTLNLGGTVTNAGLNLATFARTGGVVNLTGTIDNTGAELVLTAGTGNFVLSGGTVKGGTLTAAGGQLQLSTTGILDGVTLVNDMSVGAGQNATLKNTVTLTNTNIAFSGTGGNSILGTSGTTALAGTGTVTLVGNSNFTSTLGNNGVGTLTIGAGVLVRGGGGSAVTSGVINPTALVNQGVISNPNVGKTVSVGGSPFVSSGTLTGAGDFTFTGINTTISGVYDVAGATTVSSTGSFVMGGTVQSAGLVTGLNTDFTVNSTGGMTSDGIRARSLIVNTLETVRPNGTTNGTSKVSTLTLAGVSGGWIGRLELNNNLLIVQANSSNKATMLTTIRDQALAGAGGSVGITSATVLNDPVHKGMVVVDNGLLGLTGTWNGQAVTSTSILIGATYLGDSNFDRKVNVTDLGVLATFYGQTVPNGILQGDFNGDGVVNVSDLGALATNYGAGTAGGAFTLEAHVAAFPVFGGAAGVPEPASVGVLGVAGLLLVKRRAKRGRR